MKFLENLLQKSESSLTSVFTYFMNSHISFWFFFFILLVLVSSIIKRSLIMKEKKSNRDKPCKFLINNGQDCGSSTYKHYYDKKLDNCDGCPGKLISMTDDEAENIIMNKSIWMKFLIFFINFIRDVLPYASFLYTLLITLFEKD